MRSIKARTVEKRGVVEPSGAAIFAWVISNPTRYMVSPMPIAITPPKAINPMSSLDSCLMHSRFLDDVNDMIPRKGIRKTSLRNDRNTGSRYANTILKQVVPNAQQAAAPKDAITPSFESLRDRTSSRASPVIAHTPMTTHIVPITICIVNGSPSSRMLIGSTKRGYE